MLTRGLSANAAHATSQKEGALASPNTRKDGVFAVCRADNSIAWGTIAAMSGPLGITKVPVQLSADFCDAVTDLRMRLNSASRQVAIGSRPSLPLHVLYVVGVFKSKPVL